MDNPETQAQQDEDKQNKNTTQKTKQTSKQGPHEKNGVYPNPHEG